MAKGDAMSGAGGQMAGQAAPNNKMDQYSVMHHLMQQMGQNQPQQGGGGFGGAVASLAPSLGALMGSSSGMGQPQQQMANNYQTQQQMPQMSSGFGNQMGYGQQQMRPFNRFGNGPMINNMGMQGSMAPQNRFRQQLNQQPATDTNQPQQV